MSDRNQSRNVLQRLVNPNQRFNAAALEAVKAFARSKPWRGSIEERKAKFQAFHAALGDAYDVPRSLEFIDVEANTCSLASRIAPTSIQLHGKLSVITYVWLFCLAREMRQLDAARWTLSLFARFFPLSFSRCELRNGPGGAGLITCNTGTAGA